MNRKKSLLKKKVLFTLIQNRKIIESLKLHELHLKKKIIVKGNA